MAKALYLARVELHNCEDLYDQLHEAMEKAGFSREGVVLGSGEEVELPHATYFGTFKDELPLVSKLVRLSVKAKLKVPVRKAGHTRRAKTFSFMVAKLDGVAQFGGLQPKKSSLAVLMEMMLEK